MKVLLITHSALSKTTANGNVMCNNLFSFSESEICSLFFNDEQPTEFSGASHFKICDKDIIKHLFSKGDGGEEVEVKKSIPAKTNFVKHPILRKISLLRSMRECFWEFSKISYKKMFSWIEKERPDRILFVPSSCIFSIKIAIMISNKYNIPIYLYTTEDEYFHKYPFYSFVRNIHQMHLKKMYAELFSVAKKICCVHDGLTSLYSNEFSIPSETISISSSNESFSNLNERFSNLLYAGNIDRGRDVTLAEISKQLYCLDKNITLNIIPSCYTKKQFKKLSSLPNTNVVDFLPFDEYKKTLSNCDCLLLIESFRKKDKNKIKSIFTGKIADYIFSGRPLLVVSPDYVYECKYFNDNKGCAIVCTDLMQLKQCLNKLINDFDFRKNLVKNCLQLGKANHSLCRNSSKFKEFLETN